MQIAKPSTLRGLCGEMKVVRRWRGTRVGLEATKLLLTASAWGEAGALKVMPAPKVVRRLWAHAA